MARSHTPRLTRRGLLAAGGAAGLGALLTACGDGGGSDSGGGGSWSFTDDRKKKVSLKGRPERVVAYVGTAAALHDFGVDKRLVGVFGPTKLANGQPDPQAGDLPVDRLEVIGSAFGEFDIERYAKLRPDVLIAPSYQPGKLWFVPEESKEKILELAPGIALKASQVSLSRVIRRHGELAGALGADLEAKKVSEAKRRFEKAAETLRETAEERGGLKVLATSGSRDLFYVATPKTNADLIFLRELGVEVVVPDKVDKDGYFEPLSWENADKYGADVIMLDNRGQALQPEALRKKPTWTELPAVQADQVIPWAYEPRFSYQGSLPLLEKLASTLREAGKVR
ncbi:ABC transporter substrate-binding protein [Streptomyces oceani]|uniref:ABC transporter substrate-binding protein n=1 Tax=Streptomyces oceani TaxID=1075402 RepID=A0A1E7KGM6_9ACTN|nr:ABC transporter substrate-binding protein [Streptomyces oceani]OEV03087.1 ABC transporter substrate-binding protein [Streptomyces oceani]